MGKKCHALNLVFAVSLFLLLTASALPARAESLAEFEGTLITYQTAPLERTKALLAELDKMRMIEVGIARQNNIPKSRVLEYELTLDDMVNTYHSLYFLQRHGSTLNLYLLDEESIAALAKKDPPYTFLEYINFMEDADNCEKELQRQKLSLASAQEEQQKAIRRRDELERKFRLTMSKIEHDEGDKLYLNWELKELKAQLEDAIALHVFYRSVAELDDNAILAVQNKLAVMDPLLDKMRDHVKSTDDDFKYLDKRVYDDAAVFHKTIDSQDKLYGSLAELKGKTASPTEFMNFYITSEQALIERECGLALNMAEYILSLRVIWRALADLLEGQLDTARQQQLLKRADATLIQIQSEVGYCNTTLMRIRETKEEAKRRFQQPGPDTVKLSDEEGEALDRFLDSLDARLARHTHYLSDLAVVRSQYRYLRDDVRDILDEQPTDKQIQHFWYQNFYQFIEKEIFHFGDYPVTLGKIIYALLTFITGVVLTLLIGYAIRKREEKLNRMTEHSILILRRLIVYFGIVVSALFAMWHLNIPFTAFAFLGGALAIAFGFGTQKILSDFLSGMLLLFQRKIRVGDEVIIGDERGIVRDMTIHDTILRSRQSRDILIPNTKVQESAIVNLTLHDTIDRIALSVSVAYDSDIKRVREVVREILDNDKRVLNTPAPRIFLEAFEDSSLKITAWFFIDISKTYEADIAGALREEIFGRFNKEGIKIPFPQTDIYIKKTELED